MGKALIFSGLQVEEPLQKVTLLQSGLITPTLSISSNNEETDTTFSFTISAENATKVSYIVKEYSEGAPSDIFSEGESITISELPKKLQCQKKLLKQSISYMQELLVLIMLKLKRIFLLQQKRKC